MDETTTRGWRLIAAVVVTATIGMALAVLASLFGMVEAVFISMAVLFVMAAAYETIYGYLEKGIAEDGEYVTPEDDSADALKTLRVRYAKDELSEAEFEQKLETETVADAERHVRRNGEPATEFEAGRAPSE